jgi:hypothetical protein
MLAVMTLNLWGFAAQADTMEHIGTFDWPSSSIVGLSGLEVSDDGQSFYAVSDQGWFLSGTLQRDPEVITGVDLLSYLPILDGDGLPVAARRSGDLSDAEGLAVAADGSYWISFERWARVARYQSPTSKAEWIEDHPSFFDYADNRQLEALALAPDGHLYTFPEKPLSEGFPIYKLTDAKWDIVGHIPDKNGFSVVGADFAANGDMYLLERKLVLGLWWQSRVRRLNVEDPDGAEVLWTSARGQFDNVEGIAVWEDAIGLRFTMISDDNSDPDEPTQIIEFRLVD